MKNVKQVLSWSGITLLAMLVIVQLVPIDRTNPPVGAEVPAPPAVRAVLRRACYDCHSNETVWPWYSRVAPVSWLIASDVHEGRGKMNFSAWNQLPATRQEKLLRKCWGEIAEGEMPPWYYLLVHANAQLSAEDRSTLQAWLPVGGGAEREED